MNQLSRKNIIEVFEYLKEHGSDKIKAALSETSIEELKACMVLSDLESKKEFSEKIDKINESSNSTNSVSDETRNEVKKAWSETVQKYFDKEDITTEDWTCGKIQTLNITANITDDVSRSVERDIINDKVPDWMK